MGSSVNDRELVLETLLLITKEGEYSHIALKNVLDQYQYLDKKERAFITRAVSYTHLGGKRSCGSYCRTSGKCTGRADGDPCG